MDVENSFIRPILSFYYGKGMSEAEAHEEISKKYGPKAISTRTIAKWYESFRPSDNSSCGKSPKGPSPKFTDEFLIDLVNNNPNLNIKELAKLANCSGSIISKRIKRINLNGEVVRYRNKSFDNTGPPVFTRPKKIFTDEYLINLVNDNPNLSMVGLAKLANCSPQAISQRLQQINRNGIRVNYVSKACHIGIPKFTDEYLIKLIKNNPGITISELAKLSGCTNSSIYKRIRQINFDSEIIKDVGKEAVKKHERVTDEFLIKLINENTDLSIMELAKMADYAVGTMYKRLRKLNRSGEIEKYKGKREVRNDKKFTDEFLISLISKNPDSNMVELAKLAGCSQSTISKRIKAIDRGEEKANYRSKGTYKDPIDIKDEFLIDLIKNNTEISIKHLAELTDTSSSFIIKRLKKLNNYDERVENAIKKLLTEESKPKHKPKKRLTDEFLIDLINSNPELNMKELADLAGISKVTISTRIKKINSEGGRK
jgi:DNA-binding Lrp family transcriptional regulator